MEEKRMTEIWRDNGYLGTLNYTYIHKVFLNFAETYHTDRNT